MDVDRHRRREASARRRRCRAARCGRRRGLGPARSSRWVRSPSARSRSRRSRTSGAPGAAPACSMPACWCWRRRCCARRAHGAAAMFFLFAVVWVTDILGYFVGRTVGGPRLALRISPKKTWSGAVGGALGAVAAGVVFAALTGYSIVGAGSMALRPLAGVARRRSGRSPRSSDASASRMRVTSFPATAA